MLPSFFDKLNTVFTQGSYDVLIDKIFQLADTDETFSFLENHYILYENIHKLYDPTLYHPESTMRNFCIYDPYCETPILSMDIEFDAATGNLICIYEFTYQPLNDIDLTHGICISRFQTDDIEKPGYQFNGYEIPTNIGDHYCAHVVDFCTLYEFINPNDFQRDTIFMFVKKPLAFCDF